MSSIRWILSSKKLYLLWSKAQAWISREANYRRKMITRKPWAISFLQKKKDHTLQSPTSENLPIQKEWHKGARHKGMTIELCRTHLAEMASSSNCLAISRHKIPQTRYCRIQWEWKRVRCQRQIRWRESAMRKPTINRLKYLGKNTCVCSES